jgi:hypothetical protein
MFVQKGTLVEVIKALLELLTPPKIQQVTQVLALFEYYKILHIDVPNINKVDSYDAFASFHATITSFGILISNISNRIKLSPWTALVCAIGSINGCSKDAMLLATIVESVRDPKEMFPLALETSTLPFLDIDLQVSCKKGISDHMTLLKIAKFVEVTDATTFFEKTQMSWPFWTRVLDAFREKYDKIQGLKDPLEDPSMLFWKEEFQNMEADADFPSEYSNMLKVVHLARFKLVDSDLKVTYKQFISSKNNNVNTGKMLCEFLVDTGKGVQASICSPLAVTRILKPTH